MIKHTIIVGLQGWGKSTMAKKMADAFSAREVVVLQDAPDLMTFHFAKCTRATKLVIIDELENRNSLEKYFLILGHGLVVRRKGKRQIIIHPQFVFTTQDLGIEQSLPERLKAGVDFIHLTREHGGGQ